MDVVVLRWWANPDLLCSYHGEGAWSFCISLCAVYPSFCVSGFKLCTPGCPVVLAWLPLQVWSKHTHIHIHLLVFLHKDETSTHLPHDMQQSICYSYAQSRKPTVTGRLNAQHQDQYSKWRHGTTFSCQRTDLVPCIICVPTPAQKAFNFELWLFKKCKGSTGTKFLFFFHVEKNTWQISETTGMA